MKRLIVRTMMIICIILILFSSYSLAKSYSNYTSKEIREEYKKNNDIINELSDKELNAWEKEMKALLNLMTSNPQASYSNEDKELTKIILNAISERKSKLKQDSLSKEEKESVDEKLINAIKDKDTNKCSKILRNEMDLTARQNFKKNYPQYYKEYISFLKKEGNSDEYIEQQEKLFEKTQEDVYEDMEEKNNSSEIYTYPKKDPNTAPENASSSIDDMINDAKSFISQGKIKYANDGNKSLKNVSNTVYNILLVVGTSIAVIMGAILGIKLMASGVEEKAEVKKLLIPYVVGCIVIFGGFGIWKLAVTILQGI